MVLNEPFIHTSSTIQEYLMCQGMRLPFKDPDEWCYGEEVEKTVHEAGSYGSNYNHHHCCKQLCKKSFAIVL